MANPASRPILEITRLTVGYRAAGGAWLDAVREVSLSIQPGQVVGLVGESGSGKSSLALAVMRCLPPGGAVRAGQVRFAGRDVYALSPAELQGIRGAQVAFIPQDPFSALNPSLKIGVQIGEVLRWHQALPPRAARAQARRLLHAVRMPDPDRALDSYPHQLSGGMQQRALIALALSADPLLLVLDEPTTALDVTTEAAILDVFRGLMNASNAAALYVTHNLGVVARICDRVAVLYAGELVEDSPAAGLYRLPLHPYTRGLLACIPRPGAGKDRARLTPIGGRIPHPGDLPPGCVFAPRCPLAVDACHSARPPLEEVIPGRRVRCYRWEEVGGGTQGGGTWDARGGGSPPLLEVDNVAVRYGRAQAVADVSLELAAGQTLGIVGESGSGKTTLARAIAGLVEPARGEARLMGVSLPPRLARRPRALLREIQMIFQNPLEALNPHLAVGESLCRPLVRLAGLSRAAARAEAAKLLAAVGLPADYAARLPGQLSGGERQRAAIARAFAARPKLLLADEPVSALDVSVQAAILNLVRDLQAEHDTALAFISHDLSVVGWLADAVAVMYLGRVVQTGTAAGIFEPPYHPYTEALLSAIPIPDPDALHMAIRLEGEVPGAANVPPGCPFHTRCPRVLGDVCRTERPPWQEAGGGRIACHIPLEALAGLQAGGQAE
jgi:peptide/nickel transport system ATP-binding protein